ncbi:MAG: Txe/YoeB family addiction module toxin [Chitinophagaceae bacterium]|jgi:toxin YoeB
MDIRFTPHAWKDYLFWHSTDKKMLNRINKLIIEISRNPHDGIGKPERLKGNFSGWLSRRINLEHRLIYSITDDAIIIIACRYHYE